MGNQGKTPFVLKGVCLLNPGYRLASFSSPEGRDNRRFSFARKSVVGGPKSYQARLRPQSECGGYAIAGISSPFFGATLGTRKRRI